MARRPWCKCSLRSLSWATRDEESLTYLPQAAVQAGKSRPGNLLTRSLLRLHTPELLLHAFWTLTEIGIR